MKNSNRGFAAVAVVIILLILAGGGGYVYYKSRAPIVPVEIPDEAPDSTTSDQTANSPEPEPTPTASTNPWSVVQQMLVALRNHDLNGMNSLSYKAYKCPTMEMCNQMFDFLATSLPTLRESDFVNRWEDSKQLILSTSPKKMETAGSLSYQQGFIYFTKSDSGDLKVVTISPSKTWGQSITGSPGMTTVQIDQQVQAMMVDSDQDGLTDNEESCSGASQYNPRCVKSDPNKRDTDGDGLWDGTELHINQLP